MPSKKLTRLEALSLERGWSYARLAEEVEAVTGQCISSSTLHRVAKGGTASRLNQHKIDAFFAALDAPLAKRA